MAGAVVDRLRDGSPAAGPESASAADRSPPRAARDAVPDARRDAVAADGLATGALPAPGRVSLAFGLALARSAACSDASTRARWFAATRSLPRRAASLDPAIRRWRLAATAVTTAPWARWISRSGSAHQSSAQMRC